MYIVIKISGLNAENLTTQYLSKRSTGQLT